MNKKQIIILCVLGLGLVFSLFSYFSGDRYKTIRLKYYSEVTKKANIEERRILISNGRDFEKAIIEELFLGPISPFNKHFTEYGVKPNTIIFRGNTAYIDLPMESFINKNEYIELIKDSVLLNSKKISNVIITLDGQIPGKCYIIDSNKED